MVNMADRQDRIPSAWFLWQFCSFTDASGSVEAWESTAKVAV